MDAWGHEQWVGPCRMMLIDADTSAFAVLLNIFVPVQILTPLSNHVTYLPIGFLFLSLEIMGQPLA